MYRIKEFLVRLGLIEQSLPAGYACAICFDTAIEEESGEANQILECGHTFHKKCIVRWIKRKNVCPICRRQAVRNVDKQDDEAEESFSNFRRNPRGRPPLSTYLERMAEQ